MRNRLLSVIALLSVLLFATAALAWVRSFFPERLRVTSSGGKLVLYFYDRTFDHIAEQISRQGHPPEVVNISGATLLHRLRGRNPPNDYAHPSRSGNRLGFELYRPGAAAGPEQYCILAVPYA